MASLNPQTLCNNFTQVQIQEKVDFYLDQMDRATIRLYDKDSTQGRQKVESEEIQRIESILQSWLKALECKKGLGKTHIVSGNFRNGRFY